ncbi:MAG: protein kinase [Polyangiaceae bacterium]
MDLTEGTRVTDKIVLLRPLGEGGMATVWLAHHAGLDVEVAVKFLRSRALQNNPRLSQRFRAEASVAARIRSPYVVQMLDYGVTDEGQAFLVMELLDGEPLDALLDRRGRLTLGEVATVVKHLCKALAKAHAMAVVHRDIKLSNLYNVGGHELFVKVLDFGIAKQLEQDGPQSLTLAGEVAGTPRYMSPEQLADSKDVDPRTDLWALGVVAYRLLTGAHPFSADNLADLYLEVLRGEVPSVGVHCPELVALAPSLDAWFARLLAPDRERRFANAEEALAGFPEAPPTAEASTWSREAGEALPFEPPPTTERVPSPSAVPQEATWTNEETARVPPPAADGQTAVMVGAASAAGPAPMARTHTEVMAAPAAKGHVKAVWVVAAVSILGAVSLLVVAWLTGARGEEPAPQQEPSAPLPIAPASVASLPSAPPLSSTSAEPIASPSAPPLASSEPPSRTVEPTPPTVVGRPPPPPAPVSKPSCEGDNAYTVDEHGHLVPKPACL